MTRLALGLAFSVALPAASLAQGNVELNRVTRVEIRGDSVEIVGSRPPSFTTFTMADPARLVIDLSEAVFVGVAESVAGQGPITGVKTISYGSASSAIARVVIGFERDVETDLLSGGNALSVKVLGPAVSSIVEIREADAGSPADRLAQEKAAAEAAERAERERLAQEAGAREAAARAEADGRAREEAEKKAGEEAERQAREDEAKRAEAQRKAAEEAAARLEAEKREREAQAARLKAEKEAAEQARREAERLAAEERKARAEAERLARGERIAREKAEREEMERAKREAAAQRKAEEDARREAARQVEAERRAEEKRRREAEALAREEARLQAVERATREKKLASSTSSRRTVSLVGFRPEAKASRVFIRTDAEATYEIREQDDRTILVVLPNTRIGSRNNARFLDTSFFDTPVEKVNPTEVDGAVHVEIQLKSAVPYQARQDGADLVLEFQGP